MLSIILDCIKPNAKNTYLSDKKLFRYDKFEENEFLPGPEYSFVVAHVSTKRNKYHFQTYFLFNE